MKGYTVDFKKEDLILILHFAANKFKIDPLHRQGTSSRSDLIGGFFDRWINRSAEYLVLNHILEKMDKDYLVVSDFFLFDSETEKNSPDVLGLVKKNDPMDVAVIFSQFENGRWIHKEECPFIEVKCFKKQDYLVAIRESQMSIASGNPELDYYYVIVESEIRPDYLLILMSELINNETVKKKLEMPFDFILSDENSAIRQPFTLENDFCEKVGRFNLICVLKEKEFLRLATKYEKGESFYYLISIERYNRRITRRSQISYNFNETSNKFRNPFNEEKYLPITIIGDCKVEILKIHASSCYIELTVLEKEGTIYFDEFELDSGIYKLSFREFKRSSNWTEYIIRKDFLKHAVENLNIVENSLICLLEKFDKLWRKQS